mgnify:CR=1 FL=1
MIIILSPAKTMDFTAQHQVNTYSQPQFMKQTAAIVEVLQRFSITQLSELMSVSNSLATLNYERYQTWNPAPGMSKQAILAFDGDVYDGLDSGSLPPETLLQAQEKVRILSGLYGILRPLDLIQPHRLEMGTRLGIGSHPNLYSFWKDKIAPALQSALNESGSHDLINLASEEYFRSIDPSAINMKLITPEFRDLKNGKYKMISFYAKRARGLMTRFVLDNNIQDPEDLRAFDKDGYLYNSGMSRPGKPVFTRDK